MSTLAEAELAAQLARELAETSLLVRRDHCLEAAVEEPDVVGVAQEELEGERELEDRHEPVTDLVAQFAGVAAGEVLQVGDDLGCGTGLHRVQVLRLGVEIGAFDVAHVVEDELTDSLRHHVVLVGAGVVAESSIEIEVRERRAVVGVADVELLPQEPSHYGQTDLVEARAALVFRIVAAVPHEPVVRGLEGEVLAEVAPVERLGDEPAGIDDGQPVSLGVKKFGEHLSCSHHK